MINAEFLIESTDKQHRQSHLDLNESCIERGGNSTNHKGVLAQYLNTTIPYGVKYLLCHACGNGKCSNPKHLYWGSSKENVEDAIQHGTFYDVSKTSKVGHAHTEETKKRISDKLKGRPSNNPSGIGGGKNKGIRYSRKVKQIWITNGAHNTRIKFDDPIPEGYTRGRINSPVV